MRRVVLAIPDIHAPFSHPDYLQFLESVKIKFRPTDVVCLGDEADFHALSDYDKDPDGFSAGDELKATVKELQPLYRMFSKVKVCTSNHTSRPFRKALKHGIPSELLKTYREFLQAPKDWHWADHWEVDGVIYEHGDPFTGQQAAIKAALANAQSTVIGHIHAFAGIQWSANPTRLLFGFNAGCLIDKDRYAFAYGAKMKAKPILGCGIIANKIPMFIPMILNRRGRWVGKLEGT